MNFFASSHGKGAVDGVGGKVKHSIWVAVKSRKHTVNSLQSFVRCAQDIVKSIKVIMVLTDAIQDCKEDLEKRWETIRAIPQLQSLHSFQFSGGKGCLSVSQISCSNTREIIRMYKDVETVHQKLCKDIKPGDFVLGHLETLHKTGKGSDYYALVLEKTGTVCHLRYLHSSGKLWI